jgi:hypothetical protein
MCVAIGYLAIAIHPSVPSQNLNELVEYINTSPIKLSYGHSGIGSTNHLTGELFKSLAGIPDLVQVPYRGAGPVISDLLGGQIPLGVVAITGQSLGFHRAGKLRILAVTSPKPLVAAPDIPTFAQAGFPGMTNPGSYGLLAPGGTPKSIIERIAQETDRHRACTQDRLSTGRYFHNVPLSESGHTAYPRMHDADDGQNFNVPQFSRAYPLDAAKAGGLMGAEKVSTAPPFGVSFIAVDCGAM